MQAILEQTLCGELAVDIRAIISNKPNATGLDIAQKHGIHTEIINHRDFDTRDQYDHALQTAIDMYQPALVVLAGFMRILTPAFVRHFQGRLINIHPSLLPAFRGLNTHQRAIDAGASEHGASVHFVTEELDGGPIIAQTRVAVLPGDTADSLATRVLQAEHALYPAAIKWFAAGRLYFQAGAAYLDNQELTHPTQFNSAAAKT